MSETFHANLKKYVKMNSFKVAWQSATDIFIKWYEKFVCHLIVFLLTPFFFFFEMTVVRPMIIETYEFGTLNQYFHVICPTFLFINVTGNMIMSILTDTKLNKPDPQGTFCEQCSIYRPADSWHCNTCNMCIMRRDHHCAFFSRCIGLKNRRYYVAYLGYLMVAMTYSIFYNYYYISSKFDNYGFIFSILRIFNPFLRFIVGYPMEMNDLFALLWIMNGGLMIWSSTLFLYHMRNVFRGATVHEARSLGIREIDWTNWKGKVVEVFGVNWFWAVLCPFVYSPIPERKLE